MEEICGNDPEAAEMLVDVQHEQILREAIAAIAAALPGNDCLLFFEQPPMPYAEIAARLSLARGSIGFIRGRCLQRLKRILEEKGF